MDEIEDADIIVDLSGGKLMAKKYRERIQQLQAEKEAAKKQLYEIAHLCENCRSLNDAIYIVHGRKNTSTKSGCDRCWVDELQTKVEKLRKAMELIRYCGISRRCNQLAEQALEDSKEADFEKTG